VNLVDDAVRDRAQRLAGAGGQQQMQRFRRGDQNVWWPADQALTLGGGRVTGADRRFQQRQRMAHLPGRLRHAFERYLQVAMDVVVRRRRGGDVGAAPPPPPRPPAPVLGGGGRRGSPPPPRRGGRGDGGEGERLPPQSIQAGEEGGQGLARAGRGE